MTEFNYSDSCWKKIRVHFDEVFGESPFKFSDNERFYKYLDSNNRVHIVSFYNNNPFHKSQYDKDFKELHGFLNQHAISGQQIHIVCANYIASASDAGLEDDIQRNVKYYYLTSDLVTDKPKIEEMTRILLWVKKDKNKVKKTRRYESEDISERSIMRDLENGEGEKHGF